MNDNEKTFTYITESKFNSDFEHTSRKVKFSMNGSDFETFQVNNETPGFRVFAFAITTCNVHMYMIALRDQNVPIIEGVIRTTIFADDNWMLRNIHIKLLILTMKNNMTGESVEKIKRTIKGCPLSRNIANKDTLYKSIEVNIYHSLEEFSNARETLE